MTVVTPVATENRMTTHAIFFLIYGCPMSGTILKEKSSFKDDDDDNNGAKVCAVLLSAKELGAKNDDERSFSRIRRRPHDSWNLSGADRVLSHRRNLLKLCVSRDVGVRGDDGSLAYPASSHGEMRM